MRQKLNIWVMGGDGRQSALAAALAEDGHTVHTWALERGGPAALAADTLTGAKNADCVVLPLPAAEKGRLSAPLSSVHIPVEQVLDALAPGQLVCAGRVDTDLADAARQRQLRLVDYFAREELAVANAIPTGEGAVQLALEELPITLHGAGVLILGYGRLGRVLARQFRGLGSRVTVAARRCEALAWAQSEGCASGRTDQLGSWLCGFDLVVNTVPHLLLDRDALRQLKPDALVIDLASRPGGVDFTAAAELGVKVIWALSLPGKTAPITAGLAIRNTIYNILSEEGF